MTSDVCRTTYATGPGKPALACTFRAGHDGHHSWRWLQREMEAERRAPSDIEVLIGNIAEGKADAYLEAILAAAHGRKRALRGVTHPYGTTVRL